MAISSPSADFVTSSLSGGITAVATSATIGTGLNLPASNGVLQIDYDSSSAVGVASGPETVIYTSYNSGTGALSGITRGIAGTTGVTHSNGASVQAAPSSYYFTNNGINPEALATNAITLGYAQITNNFSTASTSAVQVTGLSVTVTVPSGGRKLKITVYSEEIYNTNQGTYSCVLTIWDGTVGSGTMVGKAAHNLGPVAANTGVPITCICVVSPSAGIKTYNVGLNAGGGGTATMGAGSGSDAPAYILVEAI